MNDFAAKIGLTGAELENLIAILVRNTVILIGIINVAAVMTLVERKVSAWMQFRHGPNRVGPWGLLQPLADGVKFIFKEVVIPYGANKPLYLLAPALAAVPAMMTVAVIPFAGDVILFGRNFGPLVIADIDVGILYLLAIGSMSVYGVILAGWASNSKYSLLGGLRASAQMISYELSMILAILAVVAMAGTINLKDIALAQASTGNPLDWFICKQPLAWFLLLVASFAETNRHPFDFAECEPELVAGFNTEYSAMKWAIFFIGEYSAMAVMSSLSVILFFGGWSVPFLPDAPWYLGFAAFLAKVSAFLFLFVWVRWTIPRFRFDQLMRLGWKVMLPLALINLLVTGGFLAFFGPPGAP
jgi:NADH-quinone oxidoreductase subunit H